MRTAAPGLPSSLGGPTRAALPSVSRSDYAEQASSRAPSVHTLWSHQHRIFRLFEGRGAIPVPDPGRPPVAAPLRDKAARSVSAPSGCECHARCPFAIPACRQVVPPLEPVVASGEPGGGDGSEHVAACIRKGDI